MVLILIVLLIALIFGAFGFATPALRIEAAFVFIGVDRRLHRCLGYANG